MFKVLKAGFSNLSYSSRGEYRERTDEVKAIRHEMLTQESAPAKTKQKFASDRKNIGNDMRRAASKIALNNG